MKMKKRIKPKLTVLDSHEGSLRANIANRMDRTLVPFALSRHLVIVPKSFFCFNYFRFILVYTFPMKFINQITGKGELMCKSSWWNVLNSQHYQVFIGRNFEFWCLCGQSTSVLQPAAISFVANHKAANVVGSLTAVAKFDWSFKSYQSLYI